MRTFYRVVIKRFFDILVSLIIMPFVLLITVPVAIAILIEDHGPIFYLDKRLGKNIKEFKMLKFRSMKVNALDIRNEDGTTYNSVDDPRVTKVGKFIRKTSIDELPQVFNILIGQMSFIGPRPERPEIYNETIKEMPEFKYRLVVKAGLTGYAQIYGKYNTSLRDKLLLDIYYIEN